MYREIIYNIELQFDDYYYISFTKRKEQELQAQNLHLTKSYVS